VERIVSNLLEETVSRQAIVIDMLYPGGEGL
jgi:hypothetical protein